MKINFIIIQRLSCAVGIVTEKRLKYSALIDFGGHYIYRNDNERTEYNYICSKHMDSTMKSFLVKMGTIFLSFCAVVSGPIHAYFCFGEKTTTFDFRVPFTDEKSISEFVVNMIIQFVIAINGIIIYVGLEVFMSLFGNFVTVSPLITKTTSNIYAGNMKMNL